MYSIRHPIREYKDKVVRVIIKQSGFDIVYKYDDETSKLTPEIDLKVITYILDGESGGK